MLIHRVAHRTWQVALSLLIMCAPLTLRAQRIWLPQGPAPNTLGQVEGITDREVTGAVKSVAAHPTNADVLFVGAVNGGIWRTGNATAASPTWVSQLGLDQSLSIGAIAFDPTDATNQTLLAGTGRFSSFNGRGNDRTGVYRTADDGATWTLLTGGGTVAGLNISGVAPRGATLVISANTANNVANAGVWRSTDTGGTWTRVSGGMGTGLPNGGAHDMAGDPSNNARLFTNAGANGIYRSDDTGATWTKVSTAAVDAALAGNGNVKISVGASNNVYVATVVGGRLNGLFRSGDGGTTWAALDIPQTTENAGTFGIHPGSQGTTHLSIAADPTNANVVYIGGDRQPHADEGTGLPVNFPNSINANDFSGRLYRVDASLAAGAQAVHITHGNTSNASSPHADSRDMAFDANGALIETDDGGVYRRTTPLLNTGDWFSVNGNLSVTELHDVAWDSRSKIAIGGAQDTGVPEQGAAGNARWQSVTTADGGDVAVDDFGTPGQSTRYASNQNLGNFRRRVYDAGNQFISQTFPALTVVGGGAALTRSFKTPIALNGVTATRLIIGGANSVYESLDQGATITEIGPGIVVNNSDRDPIAYGATGNADMLYVGSGTEVFIRSVAGGALTQSATYPGAAAVCDIVMDPAAPLTSYVIDATTVFRTTDGGATWTNITGNLLALTPGNILSVTYSTSNADGSVVVGTANGAFIAPGPAFNVWSAVASGLPRAPVYDVEYDAADEILVAGVLGRGAWTVSLEERDPVDVALTLDLSGSMLSPACSGCDSKLQVLKDAVELFVQLWTVFTIPADRFALNYFRTNINEFAVGPDFLFPIAPNAATVISDVQGQTTTGAQLTAMGGGIQAAVNRLSDATRPRNIIAFTDGMQNVNPMVNTTSFVVENQSGRPNSNISPTAPATDLNAALGIKVNTIGVGATPAFVDLLDDIASETNGLFKLTTAPDEELRRFYVEELIDALRQFSPQLLDYRYSTMPSDTSRESFVTNASTRRLAFKVSWKRGSQLAYGVSKDGVDVTRSGRFITGPYYRIFFINVPTTSLGQPVTPGGTWQLHLRGTKGIDYEVAAIIDEEALEFEYRIEGRNHKVGDLLPLRVRVTFAGQPVTNATVTARVLAPAQSLATALATRPTPSAPIGFQYEAGATLAQRKYQLLLGNPQFVADMRPVATTVTLTAGGDGSYTASIPNTQLSGLYTVVFTVSGTRADIGTFRRTETRAVSVRFGRAVPGNSGTRVVSRGNGQFDLVVRPVDDRGNYLGPDYGHAVSVLVNGTRVTATPVDQLDGSYVIPFTSSQPTGSTTVQVNVFETPLYDGPLSGIPQAGGGRRVALSLHAGLAIPTNGFASGAKAGLLVEGDVELRLTPRLSLEGIVGRYDFDASPAVSGGALFLKGYGNPGGGWRPYLAGGIGAYRPRGGATGAGLAANAGLLRPLGGPVELDLGAGYIYLTQGSGAGFATLRAGLKLAF